MMMPKHDDYLQSPFYGRAFMACSWDHAMGEFCVNCKDIELAISAAVAEAVAAEREACWKIANEFAQQLMSSPIFTTGSAKMAMAEEIAAAIRARGGGETSNTD